MHIKELVLDDFKSFGRKTRIPLYEDFTVITGPNGSGKSNIIDGVLFALGLARTRGIRAEKLTDLIYNPGDDAAEGGPREASVEVVLNNEQRTLTRQQIVNAADSENVGDIDEIRIRRRVKETDDNYYSYYYLNDRSVNLSDIQDLLAQAGVTPEGYNVVMQGDVTEIINMTAYRRREIIDEIAGVAEFDAKKEDAFAELETVEERIEEADLRIDEKRDRLDQLADERETALEYRELKDDRAEYEGYLKAAELEDKRAELETTEAEVDDREDDLDALRSELDEKQGRVSRLEDELSSLNRDIERKGEDEQLRIKSEIEEVKGDISRLEDKVDAAEERIEAAEAERREAFVEIDRKQEEIDDVEDEIRQVKVETANLKSDVAEKRQELADVETEIENADTEYDELKADLGEKKDRLEELRRERSERKREHDRLLDEARRRAEEVEDKREELTGARESIPDHEKRISELHSELDTAEKNVDKAESVVDELRAKKDALQADLDDVEETIREKQNEYAELEARAGDDGDVSWPRAVTTVDGADIDGVHGPVGDLGSVDSEYATACETAAGGRLANVVVVDDGVGQSCIDYLKSRNAGRATFLPITEMDDRSLPRLPDDPGVVDFARNLVEYDAEYDGVFSYVLGSTLVVEDMATARHFMGDYRMVTLDGDLVEKSGAMTGGSGGGSRYAFSKSGKGKLERVAEEIHDLEDERATLKDDIAAVEDDLEDAHDRKTAATEKVTAVESDLERAEEQRDDAEARIEELEAELEALREERAAVDEEMQSLDSDIDEYDAEIADIEAEVEDIEAELADSKIPALSERADEIRADIADLKGRVDDLNADRNELELEKGYAEDALEDLHDTVEEAQNRKAELESEVDDYEDRIAEKEAVLEDKREAVAELEDELAELKADREELKAELRSATEARNAAEEKVDSAESELEELRDTADRLAWEIDELEAEVGEYDADDVPDHDTVEAEIKRLTGEMETLEPVNMLAIEEYDEVEGELDGLQSQRDVLEEERDAIERRIDEYESQKKATFMESYEAISSHFEDIFERLSSGTGELVLEDPADPFEEGLTMKAQPADKPVQRLDAMSGGEKSLTALAFIFAIQRHNPAPFYALDEVDAFLDAVNAERVGEMVHDLAGEAQFAVVSHRSALLDRSERALGVTMQDDNVSAVTGIQLGDDVGDGEEVMADD
ncbi:MAG: chromosome segregation protein SMC [Halolamina sp.]